MVKATKSDLIAKAHALLNRPGAFSTIPLPRNYKIEKMKEKMKEKKKRKNTKKSADIKRSEIRYDPTVPKKREKKIPTIIGEQKNNVKRVEGLPYLMDLYKSRGDPLWPRADDAVSKRIYNNNPAFHRPGDVIPMTGSGLGCKHCGGSFKSMPIPPIYSLRGGMFDPNDRNNDNIGRETIGRMNPSNNYDTSDVLVSKHNEMKQRMAKEAADVYDLLHDAETLFRAYAVSGSQGLLDRIIALLNRPIVNQEIYNPDAESERDKLVRNIRSLMH